MMKQTMLYKHGGDFPYEGEFYTYIIVNDEDIEQTLADGWYLTTTEATAKSKKLNEEILESDSGKTQKRQQKLAKADE